MQSEEKRKKRRGKKSLEANEDCGDNSAEVLTKFQLLSVKTEENEILPTDGLTVPQNVLYYGWFFNHEVSLLIKEIAYAYLKDCVDNVEQFRHFMKDAAKPHEISDLLSYYTKPGKSRTSGEPDELKYHITSKFLDRKPNLEYARTVEPFVGRKFRIHIVGLYFTRKTFGVRVKLTDAQINMFDEREGTNEDKVITNTRTKSNSKDFTITSSNTTTCHQKALSDELESYQLPVKAKNYKCKSKVHSKFAKKCIALVPRKPNDFQPTTSRAHVTIGCGPKVKAMQTGVDLLDIIDIESKISAEPSTSVFYQDYPIDGGILRQFGDAFVIYPCHEIVAEAVFNFFI